jgi:hypothetical protein
MTDETHQGAVGQVLMHFTMSLDGFVAGPGHTMDFMAGTTTRPGLIEESVAATGAVLAGRDGFDSAIGNSRPYGGAWQGPIFVLTHHPEDARPAEDITFLSCRALRTGGQRRQRRAGDSDLRRDQRADDGDRRLRPIRVV